MNKVILKSGIKISTIFILILTLSFISLVTLFGITYKTPSGDTSTYFIVRQMVYIFIGIVVFFFASNTKFDHLESLAPVFLGFSIVGLVAVEFFGFEAYNAKRWISIAGFSFQPSEFAKPSLALFLGFIVSKYKSPSDKLKMITLWFFSTFLLFILIFIEPDLGTGLMILFPSFTALMLYFYTKRRMIALVFASTLSSVLGWFALGDYQKVRIFDFFSGLAEKPSYNVEQAYRAIRSGEFLGIGLGYAQGSALRFLPSKHTDFILAAIFEFYGLVGGFFVIGFICALIFSIWSAVAKIETRSGIVTVLFIATFFTLQALVNIGMNLGLAPVTGLPLPFISYGGSAIISQFLSIGIISSALKSEVYQTNKTSQRLSVVDEVPYEIK